MKFKIFIFLFFFFLPGIALATHCPSGGEYLTNPLVFIDVCTPGELVTKAFVGFAMLMGAVAVAFTVFSGFKLIIATNEEAIKSAKESLKWSVGGFIVSLLSFTVVSGVGKFLGFQSVNPSQDQIQNPVKAGSFLEIMNLVMINFLGILGFATTLMIIYYGYRYITAAGNEESIETAKTGLKWSIVGLIITLLAFTVIEGLRKLLIK